MQMNIFDWVDETIARISLLVSNNCRWINAAIEQHFTTFDHKVRLCCGDVIDDEAEKVIFTAAKMRDDHCKRLHKKRKPLVWNGEEIEA